MNPDPTQKESQKHSHKDDASTQIQKLPESPKTENLTPEEQWERFEKELKETDWGHQPC